MQIDAPAVAECRDRFAGAGVERVDIAGDGGIDAAIVAAIGPVHHAAIRSLPPDARVERPQVLAGRRAERERLVRRRHRVEHAIDHDRLCLQAAGLAAVVHPRLFELLHVAAVDLVEARVANLLRAAAVRRPSRGRSGAPAVLAAARVPRSHWSVRYRKERAPSRRTANRARGDRGALHWRCSHRSVTSPAASPPGRQRRSAAGSLASWSVSPTDCFNRTSSAFIVAVS